MKKTIFLVMLSVVMTACEKTCVTTPADDHATVRLSFTPYEVSPMRSAVAISNYCTYLDVWLSDGETETPIHQTSSDADFGTIELTLSKNKTYTLYAVAHKGEGAATLTDDVITFPSNIIRETMFYSTTFTPATTTNLSCVMNRIIGKLRIETADAVPADVKRITMTIKDTPTGYGLDGSLSELADREISFNNITTASDGTIAINCYALAASASPTLCNVVVKSYDADNNIVQQRTFESVPFRANYKTTYHGDFFTDIEAGATFTVDDWSELDIINY